jgi:FKBP-type peptidyl-prolyl cis-trans isomerase (trigger factor)
MTTEQSDMDYLREYLKIQVTNAIEQMSDSQLEVLIKDPLKDFITIQLPQSNQRS